MATRHKRRCRYEFFLTNFARTKVLKTVILQNFTPVLQWSPENALKLNVQIKPIEPLLEAGAQIQQLITAECIDDYSGNEVSFF